MLLEERAGEAYFVVLASAADFAASFEPSPPVGAGAPPVVVGPPAALGEGSVTLPGAVPPIALPASVGLLVIEPFEASLEVGGTGVAGAALEAFAGAAVVTAGLLYESHAVMDIAIPAHAIATKVVLMSPPLIMSKLAALAARLPDENCAASMHACRCPPQKAMSQTAVGNLLRSLRPTALHHWRLIAKARHPSYIQWMSRDVQNARLFCKTSGGSQRNPPGSSTLRRCTVRWT